MKQTKEKKKTHRNLEAVIATQWHFLQLPASAGEEGGKVPGETSRVIQFLTTLTAEPGNIFQ